MRFVFNALVLFGLTCIAFAQNSEGIIREALTRQWQVAHFELVSTGEVSSNDPEVPASMLGRSTTTTRFLAPDQLWIHFEDDASSSDIVISGGKTFNRDDEGPWEELIGFVNPMANPIEGSAAMLEETQISNVVQLPDATLNGIACMVYSYSSVLRNIISQNKIWIAKSSGLPLQTETISDFGSIHSVDLVSFDYDSTFEMIFTLP